MLRAYGLKYHQDLQLFKPLELLKPLKLFLMFDPNNRTPRRQGGYRQDENPREQNGATMSADGASIRPRFNPSFTPAEGGRKR